MTKGAVHADPYNSIQLKKPIRYEKKCYVIEHMCVNNLPNVICLKAAESRTCDLLNNESNALTIKLIYHQATWHAI